MTPRRAIVSVHDKRGLVELAKGLRATGCEILSSGGTFRHLAQNGIEAVEVASYTGSPEILGGRVKTLHPRIHGGILARRDLEEDQRGLESISAGPIDLVVVNLYPFEQVTAKDPVDVANCIENIDIGGPALVRSAAKNFAHVAVVVDPDDYPGILAGIDDLSLATRLRLARKAFERVESYDRAIAAYFGTLSVEAGTCVHTSPDAASHLSLDLLLQARLRYGENPHQKAALYVRRGRDLPWKQLHGKEISYNNWLDADAAWKLSQEFERPVCAIIKHNNPCGVAEAGDLCEAWRRALECDPISAFGGIVAVNGAVTEELALLFSSLFLEVIVAPAYAEAALAVLRQKKSLRLLEVAPGSHPPQQEIRSIGVGFLVQDADRTLLEKMQLVTKRPVDEAQKADLIFAWKVAKHVKSNAIVIAKDAQAIGIGAGQMNRVDSVRLATGRARKPVAWGALASDAFFPFADGVEEAARCGVSCIIQPGGSVRDEEVIAAADRLGLAMLFTGTRHFRH